MRTKNNIKVQFAIEVKDTYSNCDFQIGWLPYQTIEDPANPGIAASKLALKFAKERAKDVTGYAILKIEMY